MYTKLQRVLSFSICLIFVFAILCSAVFIAKESNHSCTGEGCPICTAIKTAQKSVKNFLSCAYHAKSGFFITYSFIGIILIYYIFSFFNNNLVMQKIRLDA